MRAILAFIYYESLIEELNSQAQNDVVSPSLSESEVMTVGPREAAARSAREAPLSPTPRRRPCMSSHFIPAYPSILLRGRSPSISCRRLTTNRHIVEHL